MAKMEASRFAVLKIEDDYDSDESNRPNAKKPVQQNKSAGKQNASQNAKKKNKAKKPAAENRQGDGSGKNPKKPAEIKDSRQWDEWSRQDEQYVDGAFEKELQEALITSKLQYEQMKQQAKTAGASVPQNGSTGGKKKKNKKEKPVAMSLEEFSQASLSKKANHDSDSDGEDRNERVSQTPTASIPQGDGDPNFFSRVDSDVKHIVKREQMQKDFQKQYEFENAQTSKFQKELELKQKEVVMLRTTTKKLEDELQQVKKRNQQLCHILAQGEMKDKTQVLLELEDLKQVRDDLAEEVQRLTSDLEKERSKASQHSTTERASKSGKHSTK